jgi:phage baseplate assembly protein W
MADNSNAPDVFGRSLLLDDGDFVFDNGDFLLVSGTNNLLQGLNAMIYTGLGTDVFNVNYGLDAKSIFTTAQTTRAAKDIIRLNLVKSISQDSRVTLIKEIVFDDDPRYYELLPTENAGLNEETRRTTRRWQALVVLQTITQGEVALKLEGTGLNQ